MPPAEDERFAERYAALFEVLVEQSEHVERATFWGVGDGTSWLNNVPARGRTNFALLFDRQLQPKPAFYRLLNIAQNHPR